MTITGCIRGAAGSPGELRGEFSAKAVGAFLLKIKFRETAVVVCCCGFQCIRFQRKPRALHVEKALDVTLRTPPVKHDFGGHLARCEYFTVDAKNGDFDGVADEKSFVSLLITDGAGELTCGGETVPVKKGESYFLPANSGAYTVKGQCQTLRESLSARERTTSAKPPSCKAAYVLA